LLDAEYVFAYLQERQPLHSADMLINLPSIISYVPREQQEIFLEKLIRSNPIIAYAITDTDIASKFPSFDQDAILAQAEGNRQQLEFAPKNLRDFYRKLRRTSQDSAAMNILVGESIDLYNAIAVIQQAGLATAYQDVLTQGEFSIKQERLLLDIFHGFALLQQKASGSKTSEVYGSSLEESSQILLQRLNEQIGRDQALTSEERERFLASMDSPVAFLTYYLQYKDSPEHSKLLIGMFEGITSDTYSEWKFGEDTPEALEDMKRRGLLPTKITFDQYQLWRHDDQTELHESLAVDAHGISLAIRQVLYENNNHLNIEAFQMEGTGVEIFQQIQTELRTVGHELGEVNRQISQQRNDPVAVESEAFGTLQRKREELSTFRGILRLNADCMRLAHLTSKEIASGYLLEGDDLAKRVKPITRLIADIRKQFGLQEQFIFERIEHLINDFATQNQEKQNLIARDSSSPKVLLEVGKTPVGSCQHYGHGEYNDCLLGYSDSNTKIVTLENERGNPVARAVFRTLADKEGYPELHLERIYSASASMGVLRSIFVHASAKAKKMGVQWFISKKAQNQEGIEVEAEIPEGFIVSDDDTILKSHGSRAPKVYVDSAGGECSWGTFQLSGLQRVQRMADIH